MIGGTSLAGGVGSVAGAVMGAFIMASLDNGMSMMDVPTFWQYIVKGAILLLAVWMDSATKTPFLILIKIFSKPVTYYRF